MIADLVVVCWRDIPSQIIMKTGGRSTVKRLLAARFQEAIDTAAMRGGGHDNDSYLADWRRTDPVTVSYDDPEQAIDAQVADLEAMWDKTRLAAVARAGGWEAVSRDRPEQAE